jgi:hypothetical protein
VSISGYNYREAGADAPLELALTLTHAQAVARELIDRGVAATRVLPRISFFLDACSDLFEEVAKYRAARRMWAHWVRDELGVDDPAVPVVSTPISTRPTPPSTPSSSPPAPWNGSGRGSRWCAGGALRGRSTPRCGGSRPRAARTAT